MQGVQIVFRAFMRKQSVRVLKLQRPLQGKVGKPAKQQPQRQAPKWRMGLKLLQLPEREGDP